MSYKPKVVASGFNGIQGMAKIKFAENKKSFGVRMTDTGKVYKIKYGKETSPKKVPEGEWMVTISQDGTKLMGLRPVQGMFEGKVTKFNSKENEPPTPKTSNGEFPFQYFTVTIEITKPEKFSGMTVPFMPRYNFCEVDEDGKAVVGISHPKSKYTPLLQDFLDATGTWDKGSIMYKDNILPTLAKRILAADKSFQFIVKEGWITAIMSMDDAADEENPDDEEETKSDESSLPWDETDEETAENDKEDVKDTEEE